MNVLKSVAAVGLASALASPAVLADPIQNWDWALFSGWTSWTGDDVEASGGFDVDPTTAAVDQAFDTLSWSIDDEDSSLTIDNPTLATPGSDFAGVAGSVGEAFFLQDDGTGLFTHTVNGSLLLHDNNIIPAATDELESAVLTDWFSLQSAGFGLPPITSAFNIQFEETLNQADPEDCSAGQVLGGSTPCEDIFVLLNPNDLMFSFAPGDGYLYTLEVGALGLGPLNDDQCAAAGVAAGCIGLVTQEDTLNSAQFQLTLSARLIPAPAALALMGIGLLGLGYSRRRSARRS